MQTVIEPARPGVFLLAEVNPLFRVNGVIAEGQKLQAGAVLGKKSNGEYVQLDPVGNDGSEIAVGVLYSAVDASETAKAGVIVSRLAVVSGSSLTWPDEISEQDKAAAIAKLDESFLIVR